MGLLSISLYLMCCSLLNKLSNRALAFLVMLQRMSQVSS